MDLDFERLNEKQAEELGRELLAQLLDTRNAVERLQRREVGIRKVLDGVIEMFPAVEDLLPEDLDDDNEPRPRGAEAVRRVLAGDPDTWYTVTAVVGALRMREWLPNSSNPSNAVRTALERLVDSKKVRKDRTDKGLVVYRHLEGPTYDDEEPF